MARFFGSTQGERGEAHRLGHRSMNVTAASWKGAIQVQLWIDDDGVEHYRVERTSWQGSGRDKARVIEEGVL
jgi:hypothetical protein